MQLNLIKGELSSRLNLFSNIGIILICIILFTGIQLMLIIRFIEELESNEKIIWSDLIFPIFILVFTLYSINYSIINYPKITLNKTGIRFSTFLKTEFYNWTEIESIQMTGKESHSYLFTSLQLESTSLTIKGGKKKCIWADNYSNISEIRLLIESVKKQLFDDQKEILLSDPSLIKKNNTITPFTHTNQLEYSGNHILSFNGIFFYMLIGCYILAIFSNTLKGNEYYQMLLFLGIYVFCMCGLLSSRLFYFIITDKHIIIKNSVWFWYIKIYELENIKEIVLEIPYKQSTSLRIITKNYQSNLYQAESLRNPTWTDLKEDLLQKGVFIRNETNF